jgi:hypothetical protein
LECRWECLAQPHLRTIVATLPTSASVAHFTARPALVPHTIRKSKRFQASEK